MKLVVDKDVAKVAEFMVLNIPGTKLQRVARALVQLGELIWPEKYPETPFYAFGVAQEPMRPSDESQQRQESTQDAKRCPASPPNDLGTLESREATRG